ncbi:MAG: hypothetical protein J6D54_06005 [Olsenella sp.]|nr:hypothetical protein [Olsenella sp.]
MSRCGACALFREGRVEGVGACMSPKAADARGRHPTVRAGMAGVCPDFRPVRRLEPATPATTTGREAAGEKPRPRPKPKPIPKPKEKEDADDAAALRARRVKEAKVGAMGSLDKLGDKLFAELERLDALDLADADAAEMELRRAKSIVEVAGAVTANHATALSAARMMGEVGMAGSQTSMARMLGAGDGA